MNELTDEQMDAMSHVELVGELIKATEEEIEKLIKELGSEIGATTYNATVSFFIPPGGRFIRDIHGMITPRVTLTEDV